MANKKFHVMVFGPAHGPAPDFKLLHSVDDLMAAIAEAAHDAGATTAKPVGAHGDFDRPGAGEHPEVPAGSKGAVAGADIEVPELNAEKLVGLLNQIPNIQVDAVA